MNKDGFETALANAAWYVNRVSSDGKNRTVSFGNVDFVIIVDGATDCVFEAQHVYSIRDLIKMDDGKTRTGDWLYITHQLKQAGAIDITAFKEQAWVEQRKIAERVWRMNRG